MRNTEINRFPIKKRKVIRHMSRKSILGRLKDIFVMYRYIMPVIIARITDSNIETTKLEKIMFTFL
jgi:hypothetical protein